MKRRHHLYQLDHLPDLDVVLLARPPILHPLHYRNTLRRRHHRHRRMRSHQQSPIYYHLPRLLKNPRLKSRRFNVSPSTTATLVTAVVVVAATRQVATMLTLVTLVTLVVMSHWHTMSMTGMDSCGGRVDGLPAVPSHCVPLWWRVLHRRRLLVVAS